MTTLPLRSMTGYGTAERDLPDGRLAVDVRTVNHRYLNVQFRTPPGFERHHPALEAVLREFLARGSVTVSVKAEPAELSGPEAAVAVDVERARGYVHALRELGEATGVSGEPDLALLSGFRELFRVEERPRGPVELELEPVVEALRQALGQVVAMREEEGERLARDLSGRLDAMESALQAIDLRAPERLVEERDRLVRSIEELLEGTSATVDEERIAREVAHMADRWDIHEEIVRFRSHLEMFRDALASGSADGVGKRFGFIAQEILREANTMGSKANDREITARVVELKEEIERLREQLENVE
ncbi:MAG: YicC family protein [Gemmatimonadales bacterium]|nr:MAG: YicC family protein [Gemmatimonadales bacterium]